MRILFTRFPLESARGGAENQTMWLAAGLRDHGHDVSFLGSCPVLLQTFGAAGFGVRKLHIGAPPVTKFGAMSFLWRRSAMLSRLRAAIEALNDPPDVVVMLSLSEKILLTDWLVARGIRVLWIEHDRVGRWLSGNPWFSSLKAASRHATIVCVSELSRRIYLDLGFDPSRVLAIPNGVPAPADSLSRHQRGRDLVLGCVARLSPEKGVRDLVVSLERIPEVTLRIVGAGPEESFLRMMIGEDTARIGLPRITIERSVPDLDAFYGSVDALVLPSSDHDPFGLVAAEAMVRGIPVIVTDACGIAGYLHHGESTLIAKAGDAESLASCIRTLLDPAASARIAETGARRARELFALPVMIGAYERLLTMEG